MKQNDRREAICPEPTPLWTIVEELLADRSVRDRRSAMVLVLTGYFDDSGTRSDSQYCVVAGLMATNARWRTIRRQWRAALGRTPKLKYFKMAEKEGRKGEFAPEKGWTPQLARERVRLLMGIIKANCKCSVVSILKMDNYDALVRRRIDKEWDHPYLPCFFYLLISVADFMPTSKSRRKPLLVFDHQNDLEIRAHEIAAWIRDKRVGPRSRWIGRPVFSDDKRAIPIQAADLLAWHFRKQAMRVGGPDLEVFRSMLGIPCMGRAILPDHLVAWRKSLHRQIRGMPGGSFTA